MPTLEEKKKVIATNLMGWTYEQNPNNYHKLHLINSDGVGICSLEEWMCNEDGELIGGKDLSEVLGKIKENNRFSFYYELPSLIHIGKFYTIEELLNVGFWFQNPANAPKIVDAIYEAVKGES